MDSILLKDIAKSLNSVSWRILEILENEDQVSYTDIKAKLGVSQNKAAKEIARLEGALLIESKKDDIDSRVYNFKLTSNGEKILKLK